MAPVQQFVSDALQQGGHRENDVIGNDESQGQANVNKVVVGTSDGNCELGKAAAASCNGSNWHQQQQPQLPRDRRDLIELFMDLEGEPVC